MNKTEVITNMNEKKPEKIQLKYVNFGSFFILDNCMYILLDSYNYDKHDGFQIVYNFKTYKLEKKLGGDEVTVIPKVEINMYL